MNDEAGRHQIVAVVIHERAAARARRERPSETVLHQSGLELSGVDLPKLFQPDAELCGSRPSSSRNRAISRLASDPRAPSAIRVYLPRSSMPRTKLGLGFPSRPTPMSPVATPISAPFPAKSGSLAANPG